MSGSIGEDSLGGTPTTSSESSYVAQLGRISGKLLADNLERNGIPLAFETDLLYLDTENSRIGINTDAPTYEFTVNGDTLAKDVLSSNSAVIDNLSLQSSNIFTTTVGQIEIFPSGGDPQALFDRLATDNLFFDSNRIFTTNDQNIEFTPDGVGVVNLNSDTSVIGNLYSTQTINLDGDLDFGGNLIVGDEITDTLAITPNFENDIVPAQNNVFDLGSSDLRWRNVYANDAVLAAPVLIANFTIDSPANISVAAGPINFNVNGIEPLIIFDKLSTPELSFQGNKITSTVSNVGININPNGAGIIDLKSSTNITGDLYATGSITLDGNLSTNSNIIIGNEIADLLFIDTSFQQDLNPGADLTYDLGSPVYKWRNAYINDPTNISNLTLNTYIVGDAVEIGAGGNSIRAIVSNEDVVFAPATGITEIESIRFQNNDITNLNNTALTFAATGTGYYEFSGTNAILIPAGDNASRPSSPEIGDTRWNTEEEYLECFNGSIYIRAIGAGDTVTVNQVEEFGNLFSIVLG